jgi:hypothetical protein
MPGFSERERFDRTFVLRDEDVETVHPGDEIVTGRSRALSGKPMAVRWSGANDEFSRDKTVPFLKKPHYELPDPGCPPPFVPPPSPPLSLARAPSAPNLKTSHVETLVTPESGGPSHWAPTPLETFPAADESASGAPQSVSATRPLAQRDPSPSVRGYLLACAAVTLTGLVALFLELRVLGYALPV